MAITYQDKEVELNGVNYLCEVEVQGIQVDESFSHAFGVHDESDKVVTKRRIISALENLIDTGDFEGVEFDFSE